MSVKRAKTIMQLKQIVGALHSGHPEISIGNHKGVYVVGQI